jgi:hypothetical protein
MSVNLPATTTSLAAARDALREQRSGLPGLGGRPSVHPAWQPDKPASAADAAPADARSDDTAA